MTASTVQKSPNTRKARKVGPALEMKTQPTQQRSTDTFELILEATAKVLADVGIDRLSTNLVCERAGISPPALYRYFPNKYALLNELGRRLMQKQNDIIPNWITREVLMGSKEGIQQALEGLLLDTFRVTNESVAGVWITRALRAIPALASVRLESHQEISRMYTAQLVEIFPAADENDMDVLSRTTVELIYSAVEMLFDEPPINMQKVAHIVSMMVSSYLNEIKV